MANTLASLLRHRPTELPSAVAAIRTEQRPNDQISICLLGRFRARLGGSDLIGLGGRKVQELVCYVLLFRERCHHREVLAETLWGDSAGTQSRKYLRQALWQLRTLTAADAAGPPLLRMDAQWVEVSQGADFWLDVAELESAHALVQGVRGDSLSEHQAAALRRAVAAYRGELLEGCYEDWCVYERERLKSIYLELLEKLLIDSQRRGRVEEGVSYAQQILRHDRAHESTHRRMMSLYLLAGNRTTAVRQFHRCAKILRDELGVEPAASTRALYERIRAAEVAEPADLALGGRPPPSNGVRPDERLEDLLRLLTEAQSLVREQLFAVREQA
jgi:DNA-binding SARP family transcriptional activator